MKAEQRKFEDHVVRWLLKAFKLHGTRTKYMLLDLEEQYFDSHLLKCVTEGYSTARMLSLRAFSRFFPEFPVRLETRWLSKPQAQRLNLPRGLADWDRTFFARDFHRLTIEQKEGDDRRHFALIYHQPYQRNIETSLVLHNHLPIDDRVPGLHLCFRFDDDLMLMVESLNGFVASLTLKSSPASWLESAINCGFRDAVCSASAE